MLCFHLFMHPTNIDWIQQIWMGCQQCYRYSFDGRDIEINRADKTPLRYTLVGETYHKHQNK